MDKNYLENCIREWVKYSLTAAVGPALLTRQIEKLEDSEYFMDELHKFRKEVVNQVDAMTIEQLSIMLFSGDIDETTFKRPDWLDSKSFEFIIDLSRKHLTFMSKVIICLIEKIKLKNN